MNQVVRLAGVVNEVHRKMATCNQNAQTVQNGIHGQNERDVRNDQTDHHALIVLIAQTVQIALRDRLDRTILTDLQDHIVQKDQFGLTIRSVLLARKAQSVPAGLIEGMGRLARIEPKGHHALREQVDPRGHLMPRGHPMRRVRNEMKDLLEPTDRNKAIDQPVLTGPFARKVLTGQPLATGLLARTERVLLGKNTESETGMLRDDLDPPVPRLRNSRPVLALAAMPLMFSAFSVGPGFFQVGMRLINL